MIYPGRPFVLDQHCNLQDANSIHPSAVGSKARYVLHVRRASDMKVRRVGQRGLLMDVGRATTQAWFCTVREENARWSGALQ